MGEYVKLMDGGDGGRYADSSNLGKMVAKTANYTIKPSDTSIHSNHGATGSVTFTLPAPAQGRKFIFVRGADFPLVIAAAGTAGTPPAAVRIRGGVTPFNGATLTASTAGEFSSVEIFGGSFHWYIRAREGTWTLAG